MTVKVEIKEKCDDILQGDIVVGLGCYALVTAVYYRGKEIKITILSADKNGNLEAGYVLDDQPICEFKRFHGEIKLVCE